MTPTRIAAARQMAEALNALREHFMYRYCRTKKEGKLYDVPQQVLDAEAALAKWSAAEKEPEDTSAASERGEG